MEKLELILYNFEVRIFHNDGICRIKYRFTCNKDQVVKTLKEYIPLPGSITCILPNDQKFGGADLYMDYKWKIDRVAEVRFKKKDKEWKIKFNKKFNILPRTNTKWDKIY